MPSRRIIAETYPNGEFRVSYRTFLSKARKADSDRVALNKDARREPPPDSLLDFRGEFQDRKTIKDILVECGFLPVKRGWGMQPGLTRFGIRAKRTILRSGGALDGLPGCQAAITLTLPGSGLKAYQTLADWSGYAANRVKTWIYDTLQKYGDIYWFYVWELQKRGALHMHLCVYCPFEECYRKIEDGIKDAWISVLGSIEKKSGVRMFLSEEGIDWRSNSQYIQVDCQRVRQSVSAYFAKYCTKEKGVSEEHIENGIRPSRWWGCSRKLLSLLHSKTRRFVSGEIAENQAIEIVEKTLNIVRKKGKTFENTNRYTGEICIISYPGNGLSRNVYELVKSECEALVSCLLEAKVNEEQQLRKDIQTLKRRWSTNEERLRLAEIIGTDTYEWELLIYFMADSDCVTRQALDHLLEVIRTEGAVPNEEKEDAGEPYIQIELDTTL
jgi:hypothetical protein